MVATNSLGSFEISCDFLNRMDRDGFSSPNKLLISSFFVEIAGMNHLIKKFGLRSGASMLGSLALLSCGRMGPEFMTQAPEPLPVVRLGADSVAGATAARVPGSYIVMFREVNADSNLFFSSFSSEYTHHYANLQESYLADSRITNMDVLTSVDLSWIKKAEWAPEFSAPKALKDLGAGFSQGFSDEAPAGVMVRVDFESDEAAKEMLGDWEKEGRIWYAEPNEVSQTYAGELEKFASDYKNLQAWHRTIKLPEAFSAIAGGKLKGAVTESDMINDGPIIAVLDSGVDYEHPLLADNIWNNATVGVGGCGSDIHGCNTTSPSKGTLGNGDVWPVLAEGPGKSCSPDLGSACHHGTHVAGLVAAKPDASSRVGGVCPFCKIMIIRVVDAASLTILDDSQIRAFKYITKFRRNGGSAVRIANASLGKYSRSRSMAILVDVLKHVGTGTLVIGAASNEDSMMRAYPAALAPAIAVSAIGSSDEDFVGKASFSNFGSWVDIAAPGFQLTSTMTGNATGPKSGTSMAAPVVSGAAGLLLAAYPNLSFQDLRNRILTSANAAILYSAETPGGKINSTYYYPKISGETARRPLLGSGLLDISAMLNETKGASTGQPLDRVSAGCGTIGAEGSIKRQETSNSRLAVVCILLLPLAVLWRRRRGL